MNIEALYSIRPTDICGFFYPFLNRPTGVYTKGAWAYSGGLGLSKTGKQEMEKRANRQNVIFGILNHGDRGDRGSKQILSTSCIKTHLSLFQGSIQILSPMFHSPHECQVTSNIYIYYIKRTAD